MNGDARIFVLIPGMWHGGWSWKKVTPLLRAAGHEVYTPTLTGVGERAHLRYPDIDMNTHIRDITNILNYEDLKNVTLVGHSLGGTTAPAVAERCLDRISHVVNLDGDLPIEGKPVKDLLPDLWIDLRKRARVSGDEWWVPPISEWTFGVSGKDLDWMRSKLTAHPLRTWETPLRFGGVVARGIPRTFIQCTEGVSGEEARLQEAKCREAGWGYRNLPTGHDAMITAPRELVVLLMGLE